MTEEILTITGVGIFLHLLYVLRRWVFGRKGALWLTDQLTLVLFLVGGFLMYGPVFVGINGNDLGVLFFFGLLISICSYLIEKEWQAAESIVDTPIHVTRTGKFEVVRGDGEAPLSEDETK